MNARIRTGLGVIAVATVAALVVYGLIRGLWLEPIAEQNGSDEPVTWAMVLGATVIAGFLAWGVATLMERAGKARWWPALGSTVLALSILGPSYLADGASAVALIILHFTVAIILITGFSGLILPGRAPGNLSNPFAGNR
ncbi:MAG: DUF6069 family protein [Thermomicrobiales bacterium]|nr:DUF6069 family protein [Thermomicrobiales bacterium]